LTIMAGVIAAQSDNDDVKLRKAFEEMMLCPIFGGQEIE